MKTTSVGLGGPTFPAINDDGTVTIADSSLLLSGEYSRDGDDLIISGQDGQQLQVVEYFSQSTPPALISDDGKMLSGDTVSLLAGPLAPGQYAQTNDGQFGEPIGQVETIAGSATAQRPNGQTVELDVGSPVFQGDVVSAGSNSSLGITFIDKTVFTIDDGATMVLNEMVYSPSGSSNSMLFNLLGGTAAFVAGAVAKTGDMKVETPVAVMAIRGTLPFVGCDQGAASCYFGGESGVYDLLHKSLGKVIATVSDPTKIITVTSIDATPSTSAPNAAQLATMGKLFGVLRATIIQLDERLDQGQDPVREGDSGSVNFGDAGDMGGITESTMAFSQGAAGAEVELLLDPTAFDQSTDARLGDSVFQEETVRPPLVSLTDEDSRTTVNAFSGPEAIAPVPIIVSATITSGLGAVSISSDGKSLIYDPGAAYNSLSVGENATVKISLVIDQGDGTTRTDEATVNVEGINDMPAAQADTASSNEGSAVSIAVLTNDTDPDTNDDLTVSEAVITSGLGSATVSGDGLSVVYDPAGAYDHLSAGETASVVITYQVRDGQGGVASATATVTVSGLNDQPIVAGPGDVGAVTERPDGSAGENIAVLSSAGIIAFSDVDFGDSHVVSVEPAGNGYRGAFTASISNTATSDGNGSVAWQFNVNDAALDDLAASQSLVQNYAVKIDDGRGGIATQNVSVSLRGSNDAPLIAGNQPASGSATELADGDALENSTIHSATGQIAYSDADLTDTHTVSVQNNGAGYVGILTAGVSSASTGSGLGNLTWSYQVGDADLDNLSAGQSLNQSYTLTLRDGQGGITTEVVSIALHGSNDGPMITSAARQDGVSELEAGEAASIQGASGQIDFEDTDLSDSHSVSVSAAPGSNRGVLTARISDAATNDGKGTVAWEFFIDDDELDDLAASESLEQTYSINIDDGNGGVTTQNVIISLHGANDEPVIAGNQSVSGSVNELTDGAGLENAFTHTASAQIAFSDADLTDGHAVSVVANGSGYLGNLTANVSTASTGTGLGVLAWTFLVNDADLDGLGDGQSLNQTYTLTLKDGLGTTATETISITINGTNDGPEFTSAIGTGSVTEIGSGQPGEGTAILSTGGTLDFTDVELADSHTVSVATSPAGYLGVLTASISDPSQGDGNGSIVWTYNVPDADIKGLTTGQALTQTYSVNVTDSNGAVGTQSVVITINGTNNAPIITGGSGSAVLVVASNGDVGDQVPSGIFGFSDIDLTDSHNVSVTPGGSGYFGDMTAAIEDPSLGDGFGQISWTFNVSNDEFDGLPVINSVDQVYSIKIDDGNGGFDTQQVTITIQGAGNSSSQQLIKTASSVESYLVTINDSQSGPVSITSDAARALIYDTPIALTTFKAVVSDVDGDQAQTATLQLRLSDADDAVLPLSADDTSVMIAPGNSGEFKVQQLGDSVVITGLQEGDAFAIDTPAPFNRVEVDNVSGVFGGSDFSLGVLDFGMSGTELSTSDSSMDLFKFDGSATTGPLTDIIANYEEGIDVIDLTALFDVGPDSFNEGAVEDYARYISGNDNDGAADPSGSAGDLFLDADGAANGENFILLAHSATATDSIIVKVDDDAGALGYVTII